MKYLTRFSIAHLLLLGLTALLVFGSCGGGVNGFLHSLEAERRQRLWRIMAQERRAHQTAHRQLRGRARRAAHDSIETYTRVQLDSFIRSDFGRRKLTNRWPKVERQLRRRVRAGR